MPPWPSLPSVSKRAVPRNSPTEVLTGSSYYEPENGTVGIQSAALGHAPQESGLHEARGKAALRMHIAGPRIAGPIRNKLQLAAAATARRSAWTALRIWPFLQWLVRAPCLRRARPTTIARMRPLSAALPPRGLRPFLCGAGSRRRSSVDVGRPGGAEVRLRLPSCPCPSSAGDSRK